MGKKDKKKSADRKERIAEKTSKKLASKEKKASRKGNEEADPDDVDIDTILAEYARQVSTTTQSSLSALTPGA